MINHHQNSSYSFSINTYKDKVSVSTPSMLEKSLNKDYKICKSVVSNPGTKEDLLNFLSFYMLMYLQLEAINVLLNSHKTLCTLY